MRLGRLALPILACATACSPVRDYQEAARSLTFRLERVEPELRLALPLERSRMLFKVFLGVANPSTVPFHVLAFAGDLRLEEGGRFHPVGHLELARALDLPAAGTAGMEVEVSFSYQDLRDHWAALQAAAGGGPGVWHLDGALKAEAYGVPLSLPVRSERASGGR